MFIFDDLRYIARIVQLLGVVFCLGSLGYWSDTPLVGTAFLAAGMLLWFAGRRMYRWGAANDPMIKQISSQPHDNAEHLASFLGKTGQTLSPLRPMGIVEIAGSSVEACSVEGFIAEGREIRVVGQRAGTLTVSDIADG